MHRGRSRNKFISIVVLMMAVIPNSTSGRAEQSAQRVLILGGGGPVGEAWESGFLVALMDKGVDLSQADRIIGTSAGSIVGARLGLHMSRADFIKAALTPADGSTPSEPASKRSAAPRDLSFLLAKLAEMNRGKRPRQLIRAEIGAWGEKTPPVVSEAQFLVGYRRQFADKQWPATFECVTVDADDGAARIWNQSSGVPLALGVASSCALPGVFPAIGVDGHHYIDGGVRSVANADLARGCTTAVILAPTARLQDPMAKEFTAGLENEVNVVRTSGCEVELVVPYVESIKAFGPSIGDENNRTPPFNAGLAQGQNLAAEIARMWKD